MSSFDGKWVLITGASKGLGRELAKEFARNGANLLVTARSSNLLDNLRSEIQSKFAMDCQIVAGDICEPGVFKELCQAAREKQIEVLVNNAGLVSIDRLEDVSEERIESMVNLNLLVPIKLTRAILPDFRARHQGTIININSSAGRKPVAKHVVYSATKHGLRGFSEALKDEVKGEGIRILDVSPGKMATELFTADGKDLDMSDFMSPQEIAEVTIRLLQMEPGSISILVVRSQPGRHWILVRSQSIWMETGVS